MYKFKTLQTPPRPISKVTNEVSKVQSNLCPSLKQIVSTSLTGGQILGQNFTPMSNEVIPPSYDRLTFQERFDKLQELEKWYDENKALIESGEYLKPEIVKSNHVDVLPKDEPTS